MKITDVKATWLRYPIPEDRQHVSDFGRVSTFDMTLVEIVTDTGISGYGEAKAQVGSSSDHHALMAMITRELRPVLIGRDPRQIGAIWEELYNGVRGSYALTLPLPVEGAFRYWIAGGFASLPSVGLIWLCGIFWENPWVCPFINYWAVNVGIAYQPMPAAAGPM